MSSVRMGQLLLPLLRLLQDSALLNADETFPFSLLSVEIVDCAELARFFTCGASVSNAAATVAAEASA